MQDPGTVHGDFKALQPEMEIAPPLFQESRKSCDQLSPRVPLPVEQPATRGFGGG
jgi:hypothetical protein